VLRVVERVSTISAEVAGYVGVRDGARDWIPLVTKVVTESLETGGYLRVWTERRTPFDLRKCGFAASGG
jgi:hypothetical protein